MKNRTKTIRAVPAALALLLALALSACGNAGGSANSSGGGSGPTITVGSKNFTEEYILGNMYAEALKANGFNAQTKLNLGSEQIADKALQKGEIDLYPEYTGTSLVAILPYKKNPSSLNSAAATYQTAKKLYAQRKPADTMLTPAPFNNTYGIFVRKQVSDQKHITNLEQLAKASPNLTFVSYSEFQDRSDGYKNMKKSYPNLKFKSIKIVNDLGLRYQGLTSGRGDVGVGFTTDGQLASNQLVVMKDPKSIWPFYQPAPVIRSDVLKKHPKIKTVLDKVSASLDVKKMRKLNSEVDLQHKDPADVARQYLQNAGLIKK